MSNVKRQRDALYGTDYVMPLWMPFAPMAVVLVSTLLIATLAVAYPADRIPDAVAVVVFALLAIALAAVIVSLYVFYKLIVRRNQHFKRVRLLYTNVADLLEGLGSARAVSVRSIVREMEVEEQERSAVLWIVLTLLVGIVAFYVYHFLNKDFHRHSIREKRLLEEVARGLEEVGVAPAFTPEELRVVPSRSTLVYILLSLITAGVFGLYWLYTLTKDPNEHFRSHRRIEKSLVSALERAVEEKLPPMETAGAG